MTRLIDYKRIDQHIGLITLNRPEAANAMSIQLLDELNETVNDINSDESIYCVVIMGAGDKAFCAGADLKERKGMSNKQVIDTVRYIGQTVNAVENIKVPVISALNGVAFGGGLELALACDFRIAATNTKVGLTETSLAIIPGAGGTQRLPRLIGIGQAKRLIYTAKPVSVEEAYKLGIVEKLVDVRDLYDEAIQTANTIASNGPIALRQAKTAINRGTEVDLTTGLEIEHLSYKETIPTNDRLEGLKAFAEKRKPEYKGK
ncbi:enoyl-CoA hydratase [Ornithinibacillus halophilus]|uniref:Enoyl-CoA hydratase/carnithine racemase n=1 Tax=Ornithinibacillus halophilus TaxID=930117 RepID=A0A1M5CI05_9BACI|nr:enoyl-CoA hydratase [Ornithinibacillus halophilus]SHF54405.1 Enoyl-CoA hydratase/carnithine racemase [Ornithinibacillus halophilus]